MRFCDCLFVRVADGVWLDSSDKYEEQRLVWGGNKSTQMLRKRAEASGQSTTTASLEKLWAFRGDVWSGVPLRFRRHTFSGSLCTLGVVPLCVLTAYIY